MREADWPFGRQLELPDGPWLVVATMPVIDPGACPCMVLLRQPGTDPHPCDWWPVTSLLRSML